jgi:hypothetical protein
MNQNHAYDVAAASAAYALDVLQEIAALPAGEAYLRLHDLFHTAILAYTNACQGWEAERIPEPSTN